MKRIFLIAALICSSLIVLQSCSPKTTTSGAVAAKRGDVSGNWVVNDITFDGIPEVAVKSFLGESSYKCFVGSAWTLTNSGNGSYSLPSSASCAAKTQTIFWSVSPADGTFQFKKLFEGDKAKDVTDGHRLALASADGANMVIKSPIEYGGRTAYVVMNFTKAVK
ncbi:hypothetical protein FA048_08930 [Pedobacter polaris]|uniref:Lipocalin-like domain-containing protein n=1 Tax=Pedobacter polaris TaxID=2571273 RepID=A0A4U1CS38_9SPHI|nr:lipocalin family protein [Pedobacter polaris]TKC10306.1 hypothetical protein FA048_08930 [Pedobacter polaris]